ncbi:hypothetical protein AA23498_2588 [Acetobacter nitrogenifigens DSM 23921 = NBRC 105050]|uniref:DUF218 domain-containing protein n=1 Tax=Acetobacter nitrogenifigens DSM 23921 = NBRC 105050 TaxID=1120919 RepID=A0A511X623_9PROT|nr:YdcF family protein [Acetobacter nitrogenifigens]GBQ96246.1 hypothetical protein AA23498_2588 [Acetobacter nitrogenifigens DSM 23921 = NBRC 105050]GEN58394.1 hypothetical protein ANI02nite_02780 [Acetobacter nitrogenifigens DSM 23921 = NBRC 105050]
MASSSSLTAPSRRRGPLFRLLSTLCVGLLVWVGGFVWFAFDALRPAAPPPVCDGIVALTGGTGRVDASIDLLREGFGKRLLISGVDQQVRLKDVAASLQPNLAARITLGWRASSTAGNAFETATWVADHHINSLIVVTAGYHMRRALLELSRTMPDLELHPFPVQSPALRQPFRPSTLHLLLLEYNKLLLAFVAPVRFFRHAADADSP